MELELTITILPAEKTVKVSSGTRIIDVPGLFDENDSILGARRSNRFVSLMDHLTVDCTIEPVPIACAAGKRFYRDSLIFLFEMAVQRVFPQRRTVIGHSLGHSFYHRFEDDGGPADDDDAKAVENEMVELVRQNLPIDPIRMSWSGALDFFGRHRFPSVTPLISELNDDIIEVWRCGEFRTLRHAPLAARTGQLKTFAVIAYEGGFLLRYPPSSSPEKLDEPDIEPKLFSIYQEHKNWGRILGVSNVAELNTLSRDRERARDFIQTAEALHDRKIAELAGRISADRDRVKAVLIAGPSSSGKTTFTKKLALSLKSSGLKPQLISLDDYYRERGDIPVDDEGKPDFEVLEALDIELFNRNLEDLFAGRETEVPVFDFKNTGGRLGQGRPVHLDDDGIVLFEGIHGLNPDLTPGMERERAFRIYISALTQLNLDDHARIPTTDNRLIRRIVRDHQFRRYPAVSTLAMWPSVRRGEERHIFPYQGSADAMFNSALDYELAVLKVFAEPLLRTVRPDQEQYGEARRLMAFLHNFSQFPVEEVPELSIIREFIGRSGFRY